MTEVKIDSAIPLEKPKPWSHTWNYFGVAGYVAAAGIVFWNVGPNALFVSLCTGCAVFLANIICDVGKVLDAHRMETYNLHCELREAVKMFKEDEQKNSATT
jgi:hypothetical protein